MHSTLFAATAVALFTSSAIAGNANIINYCDQNIYLWPVDASTHTDGTPARNPSDPITLIPGNGTYTESMVALTTGGVSLKLGINDYLVDWSTNTQSPITQLEYTLTDTIWYDVSNVDCSGTDCPFQHLGLYMQSGDGCPTVSCTPDAPTCTGAYTLWNDDWATLNCAGDADVNLYLCSPTALPGGAKNRRDIPLSESLSGAMAWDAVQEAKVEARSPVEKDTKPQHTTLQTVAVGATPAAHHAHAHAHAYAHKRF